MAITSNTINLVKPPIEGKDFAVSCYTADASGGEDLVEAVSGYSIYVKKIIIVTQSVTDITVDIGSGQGTGVTTIHLGSIPMSDTGNNLTIDFGDKMMKCTTSTALSIDTSAGCPIWVYVEGRIA